jgi:LysM repeat protein
MSINPCPAGSSEYYIQPGDTIYNISQRFGFTTNAILNLNPGINIYNLQIGQRICIPKVDIPKVNLPCSLFLGGPLDQPPSPLPWSGAVVVNKAFTSDFSYSVVVSGLPTPQSQGNFDRYALLLTLGKPPERSISDLNYSQGYNYPLWSGGVILPIAPSIGDIAHIVPYNTATREHGEAIIGGVFARCCY